MPTPTGSHASSLGAHMDYLRGGRLDSRAQVLATALASASKSQAKTDWLLRSLDADGNCFVHLVIERNRVAMLKVLMKQETSLVVAQLQSRNLLGQTPLLQATCLAHTECVEAITSWFHSVYQTGANSGTAGGGASAKPRPFLKIHGDDVALDPYGLSQSIVVAIEKGSPNIVSDLFRCVPFPELARFRQKGKTVLHLVIDSNNFWVVSFIVQFMRELMHATYDVDDVRLLPYEYALKFDKWKSAEMLFRMNVAPQARFGPYQRAFLHSAILHCKSWTVVSKLLSMTRCLRLHSTLHELEDSRGQTPWHYLASRGDADLFRTATLLFPFVETPDRSGDTPSDVARRMGRSKVLEEIQKVVENGPRRVSEPLMSLEDAWGLPVHLDGPGSREVVSMMNSLPHVNDFVKGASERAPEPVEALPRASPGRVLSDTDPLVTADHKYAYILSLGMLIGRCCQSVFGLSCDRFGPIETVAHVSDTVRYDRNPMMEDDWKSSLSKLGLLLKKAQYTNVEHLRPSEVDHDTATALRVAQLILTRMLADGYGVERYLVQLYASLQHVHFM